MDPEHAKNRIGIWISFPRRQNSNSNLLNDSKKTPDILRINFLAKFLTLLRQGQKGLEGPHLVARFWREKSTREVWENVHDLYAGSLLHMTPGSLHLVECLDSFQHIFHKGIVRSLTHGAKTCRRNKVRPLFARFLEQQHHLVALHQSWSSSASVELRSHRDQSSPSRNQRKGDGSWRRSCARSAARVSTTSGAGAPLPPSGPETRSAGKPSTGFRKHHGHTQHKSNTCLSQTPERNSSCLRCRDEVKTRVTQSRRP